MLVDNKIKWTHWFEPPIVPGYAERCIILAERTGIIGKLFGNVRLLTNRGYVGWESDRTVFRCVDSLPKLRKPKRG